MSIQCLHINSTAPFRARNHEKEYFLEDFDVLCTILSALMWRRHNGTIKLYTDSVGYEYYRKLGVLELWDGGIDTETLERIPAAIDQNIFWAAAKLYAIRAEKGPCIMIDTDLIVWDNIIPQLEKVEVACLHREGLIDCYPPLEELMKADGYVPDKDWDWTIDPCNTALAYFKDSQFIEYYTDRAEKFMEGNNAPSEDNISRMVFAEQRILGMCAGARNITIHSFLDNPFQDDNQTFTHLWGGKDVARKDTEQGEDLCRALASKIRREFPEFKSESAELNALLDRYKENS